MAASSVLSPAWPGRFGKMSRTGASSSISISTSSARSPPMPSITRPRVRNRVRCDRCSSPDDCMSMTEGISITNSTARFSRRNRRSSDASRTMDNIPSPRHARSPRRPVRRAWSATRSSNGWALRITRTSQGHQLRLVKIQRISDKGELQTWWLLTDQLDLAAELVALGYRYRWTIELFFRWLKCVPGLQTTADDIGQWRGPADLYGFDRQPAHRLVDGSQTDQANLGDAPVLLSRLGLPGRSGSPSGETKTHRIKKPEPKDSSNKA